MPQAIYIQTSNGRLWSKRPDGSFRSSKSRLILSLEDMESLFLSGGMNEVVDGDKLTEIPKNQTLSVSIEGWEKKYYTF